jgi:YD repeat-containing protein
LSGIWLYSGEADYAGPSTILALGDAIDDVRIYPADGLISTYTFDPFRGMTSEIDPKGITITYEYDEYNRLKNIKDQDGYIIKNFCYNLKGDETGCAFSGLVVYNDAQSGSYKKDNCASGYKSDTSYPYSVAADTYAGINKTDANAKAKAAMDILGQANANALGTCAPITIPITYANLTYHNAGVSRLKFKNDAGTVVYDFTEAQLIAGQTILPGLYTAEITTYGIAYNPATQNGWGNFDFSIIGPPSFHYVQNTNAGNGPYVYVLDDTATATHIYLYINPDFF